MSEPKYVLRMNVLTGEPAKYVGKYNAHEDYHPYTSYFEHAQGTLKEVQSLLDELLEPDTELTLYDEQEEEWYTVGVDRKDDGTMWMKTILEEGLLAQQGLCVIEIVDGHREVKQSLQLKFK